MKPQTQIKWNIGDKALFPYGLGEVKEILIDGIVIYYITGDEVKHDFDELNGIKPLFDVE